MLIDLSPKLRWLNNPDIRPFVFVRPENDIATPGSIHKTDWFNAKEVVVKNPLDIREVSFADRIYSIEERAFGPSNMAMPRWVFYDCAVLPGFVAGFCIRPSAMRGELKKVLDPALYPATGSPLANINPDFLPRATKLEDLDWVPLSLFIIIPTMSKGEWVAHNLCSVNSLLSKENQFYGLGFLSKAFGLWYANIEKCTGVTQWGSPAVKLHSHYGHMQIIGSYAPVHSHAKTLTYRLNVKTDVWEYFFSKSEDYSFLENYEETNLIVNPKDELSMIHLQAKIDKQEGPFYVRASQISRKSVDQPFNIYQPKEKT